MITEHKWKHLGWKSTRILQFLTLYLAVWAIILPQNRHQAFFKVQLMIHSPIFLQVSNKIRYFMNEPPRLLLLDRVAPDRYVQSIPQHGCYVALDTSFSFLNSLTHGPPQPYRRSDTISGEMIQIIFTPKVLDGPEVFGSKERDARKLSVFFSWFHIWSFLWLLLAWETCINKKRH